MGAQGQAMTFIPETPPLMQSTEGQAMAEYLSRQMLALQTFVQANLAGHGGISLSTPTDLVPDQTITQTPVKLTGFDEKQPSDNAAVGIPANDSILLLEPGMWIVGVNLIFDIDYNTANIAREVVASLYNDTDSAAVTNIAGGNAGRYANFMTIAGTAMVNVTDQQINKEYSIYLNTLTANNVILEQASLMRYYFTRVSSFSYTGV